MLTILLFARRRNVLRAFAYLRLLKIGKRNALKMQYISRIPAMRALFRAFQLRPAIYQFCLRSLFLFLFVHYIISFRFVSFLFFLFIIHDHNDPVCCCCFCLLLYIFLYHYYYYFIFFFSLFSVMRLIYCLCLLLPVDYYYT